VIPSPTPAWWPVHLEVLDQAVDVSHLVPPLTDFLVEATALYWTQYGKPLIITSGNDGNHVSGSKHYEWKAVDLRSRDLSLDEQNEFASTLIELQWKHQAGVFDERFIGPPHWHIEVA
jgi:hypothetical protein